MSILGALKKRGAKGKNIEEAVKTLPLGGGGSSDILVINSTYDEQTQTETLDKTWQEIWDATFAIYNTEFEGEKVTYIAWYMLEDDDQHSHKPTVILSPLKGSIADHVCVAEDKDSYPVIFVDK